MDNNHQKHAALARQAMGDWGRNEWAIAGTDCGSIKQLVSVITQQLSSYKIAYADADHSSANADGQSLSALDSGAYIEYTNKISFSQYNINRQPNAFQKRALFNECDLVLVNGNHFTTAKQIIVIDDKKPLEKKLNKLTDVQLILVKDPSAQIPDYIVNYVPNIQSIPVLSFSNTEAIIEYIRQSLQQHIPAVNGLVLSGGKSMRMGQDKGNLHYHDKSQREYLYQMLSQRCSQTFLSLNEQQAKENISLPFIQDTFLGLGPVGGILSAFQHNPNVAWLTVACDLPLLTSGTIDHLISHRNPSKTATAFLDQDEAFPEPLITIWEPKAYPVLLQFLSQGYSCPRKVLINSEVELLQAPNLSAFTNVNTADEYNDMMKTLRNKCS